MLLEHGADPNGEETLNGLILDNDLAMLKLLLVHKANPDEVLKHAMEPTFFQPIKLEEIVKLALVHGANASNELNSAIKFGRNDIVEMLLDHGADPNTKDKDWANYPALAVAIFTQSYATAHLLLERGADANVVIGPCKPTGEQGGSITTPEKVLEWHVEKFRELLNILNGDFKGPSVPLSEWPKDPPPIFKNHYKNIRSLRKEIEEKLASNGGDLHSRLNALFSRAAYYGDIESLELLLKQGANINGLTERNENGEIELLNNSLMDALSLLNNRYSAAKFLIENGADVNWRNADGRTALFNANRCQEAAIVSRIVECGADINQQDNEGRTILMEGMRMGNIEYVRQLISLGADPKIKDCEGKSAIDRVIKQLENANNLLGVIKSKAAKPEPPTQPAPALGLDDLEKLALLRDRGIITEAEFAAKKKAILGL